MENVNLGPFGVLIQRDKEEKERITASGIIIPGTVVQNQLKGTVMATGAGTEEFPMEVTKGDKIAYREETVVEVTIDQEKYDLIDRISILFIF